MKTINQWFVIFCLFVLVGLLYLLAPILTPFLVGALLAYLADPLVVMLRRRRLPNLVSVLLVFLLVLFVLVALILLLIPILEKQLAMLIAFIPTVIAWVQKEAAPWLVAHMGAVDFLDVDTLKSTLGEAGAKVGNVLSWTVRTTLQSGIELMTSLINLVLIPVVTFYLLRDWDEIKMGLRNLLPRSVEPTVVKVVRECDGVLSAFFRGQLLVMLGLAIVYSVGLTLIGLKLGVMIGVIIGIASIVPYLGLIIGLIIASIAAVVQFGSWDILLLVGLVFFVGQCLESFVLTPLLVGHRIGLHPVAVIFAVLAGGTLFGFFGVLLALPVAAVVMVWLRFLCQHYSESHFYQK